MTEVLAVVIALVVIIAIVMAINFVVLVLAEVFYKVFEQTDLIENTADRIVRLFSRRSE